MDLKWLLVRRISLVALACFIAGSTLAVTQTAREAWQQNKTLVEVSAQQLDLQLSRIARSTDVPERFPDWSVVTNYALRSGQCVEFHDVHGATQRSSCAGVDSSAATAPHWFFAGYKALVNERLTVKQNVEYRGVRRGTIVASYDPIATSANAWATIAPLLGLSAALVTILCLVTYVVVDRALRPAKEILEGLNRMAKGDLTSRLPAFRLSELDRISEVFNTLSEELSKATADRASLARRLVDAQERERRHIARELHDEIAQKLAGLNAIAACVRTSAHSNAPSLADEVKQLEKMASGLMVAVRQTLAYLRPQGIDDVGLVQSLRHLIDAHNKSAKGATQYTIQAEVGVDHLEAETSAHVYRIVQEALNNASKHANASHVRVSLSRVSETSRDKITLSVIDDGLGCDRSEKPPKTHGFGLIGMKERVAALSGKLVAGPLPAGGFGLQVEFPTFQSGA